jgi:hypothetical protein
MNVGLVMSPPKHIVSAATIVLNEQNEILSFTERRLPLQAREGL